MPNLNRLKVVLVEKGNLDKIARLLDVDVKE